MIWIISNSFPSAYSSIWSLSHLSLMIYIIYDVSELYRLFFLANFNLVFLILGLTSGLHLMSKYQGFTLESLPLAAWW